MARIVNEQEFKARRNQILDVTRKLIFTRGFQQMSIQDILEEMQMSKGAFYHYFSSKPDLLEALLERMVDESSGVTMSIFQDESKTALEKLRGWYDASAAWKSTQKDFLIAFIKVWYADDNAVLRQKMLTKEIQRIAPMIAGVLRQGIQQGELNTLHPEQTAEAILYLFNGLGDKFAGVLIACSAESDPEQRARLIGTVEDAVEAYSDTIERVLGAPRGSLLLMDFETVRAWFES